MKFCYFLLILILACAAQRIEYLTHQTTLSDLRQIWEDSGIQVRMRPGIFCGVKFENFDFFEEGTILILDPLLLERKDWHYNIFPQKGDITSYTYSYPTLTKGLALTFDLAHHWNETVIDNPPEVIVHHAIPWRFILSISADNDYQLELIRSILPQTEHYLLNRRHPPSGHDLVIPLEPDFCFTIYTLAPGQVETYSLRYYQQYAANCGLSDEEISRYQTQAELVYRVQYRHPVLHPVKFWPPYTN